MKIGSLDILSLKKKNGKIQNISKSVMFRPKVALTVKRRVEGRSCFRIGALNPKLTMFPGV